MLAHCPMFPSRPLYVHLFQQNRHAQDLARGHRQKILEEVFRSEFTIDEYKNSILHHERHFYPLNCKEQKILLPFYLIFNRCYLMVLQIFGCK